MQFFTRNFTVKHDYLKNELKLHGLTALTKPQSIN